MTTDDMLARRDFLRQLDLGDAPAAAFALAAEGADAQQPVFDATREQAVVAGAEVVSFTDTVEPEFREALSDSALVAQLAANAQQDFKLDPIAWFDAYFAILGGLGWATQARDTAEYSFKADNMEVHEAILDVVTAFLGPLPGGAALVKLALDSLKSMDKDSPWITLFNREAEKAQTSRFQFTLVRKGEDGGFLAEAMCFAISAERKVTQVLFFKIKKGKTRMRRSLGTLSIGADALEGLRPLLKQKIAAQRASFLLDLPLKGAG